MATKHAKYGKAYNTPNGLQEDNYYEMMYDLMDYVNKKQGKPKVYLLTVQI